MKATNRDATCKLEGTTILCSEWHLLRSSGKPQLYFSIVYCSVLITDWLKKRNCYRFLFVVSSTPFRRFMLHLCVPVSHTRCHFAYRHSFPLAASHLSMLFETCNCRSPHYTSHRWVAWYSFDVCDNSAARARSKRPCTREISFIKISTGSL